MPSAIHPSSRQAGSVVKRLHCVSAVADTKLQQNLLFNYFLCLYERVFRDRFSAFSKYIDLPVIWYSWVKLCTVLIKYMRNL